jgi:predicted nicotinamide N-methyase
MDVASRTVVIKRQNASVDIVSGGSSLCGATTGSALWAASTALTSWLDAKAERRKIYQGKRVIELGAGLGLVGMYMAKTGARQTLLTDVEEQQPLIRLNLDANFTSKTQGTWLVHSDNPTGPTISMHELAWGVEGVLKVDAHKGGRRGENEGQSEVNWELIVAADVVYDECCVDCLAATVVALLRDSPTHRIQALFALPDRCEFDPEGTIPDYQRVWDIVELPVNGNLQVSQIGFVSSADAGTLESNICIFLITVKHMTSQQGTESSDCSEQDKERNPRATKRAKRAAVSEGGVGQAEKKGPAADS